MNLPEKLTPEDERIIERAMRQTSSRQFWPDIFLVLLVFGAKAFGADLLDQQDVIDARSTYESSFKRFYMEGTYSVTEQKYFTAGRDKPSQLIRQSELTGSIRGYYVEDDCCFVYTLRAGNVEMTNNVIIQNDEVFYRAADGNTKTSKKWRLPFFPLEVLQIPQGSWPFGTKKTYSELWVEQVQQMNVVSRTGELVRSHVQSPKSLREYDVFVEGPRKGAIQRVAWMQKVHRDVEDVTELTEYSYDEGVSLPVARKVLMRSIEPRIKDDLTIELYTWKEIQFDVSNVHTNVPPSDIKSLWEKLISDPL